LPQNFPSKTPSIDVRIRYPNAAVTWPLFKQGVPLPPGAGGRSIWTVG
jgi:hypothetical protein